MKPRELKEFLDEKANFYNTPKYLETDPLQIPHRFNKPEDIEISAFLTSLITWGNRKAIINQASWLMNIMNNAPHHYVENHDFDDTDDLDRFYYRTLNQADIKIIVRQLQTIIRTYGTLGNYFRQLYFMSGNSVKQMLENFYVGFTRDFPPRTRKHIANVAAGSAGKRLNMFLRWMVRKDNRGVDFGLWTFISPSELYIPLDVHSGRVARKLGMLKNINDNWKAVEELTQYCRDFNKEDPALYDFALFGLGVFEKF